ncbi:hypothetical protein BDK51DRAFT_52536 [Blyttiomyces helicus]|uniref:Uncharacterized protein n=1 Tax=Blyttiomyces helicus TaxID=388810 RepID=A0A4P9WI59_9FUNG|nr:hypothetical protein BDK51DRAFT_52536 [Blyttiomyces helicus]|eukprot:RKO91128.1 hypothetical protein BDK51DRAFT_52536 [Blyttiomyces helicus]
MPAIDKLVAIFRNPNTSSTTSNNNSSSNRASKEPAKDKPPKPPAVAASSPSFPLPHMLSKPSPTPLAPYPFAYPFASFTSPAVSVAATGARADNTPRPPSSPPRDHTLPPLPKHAQQPQLNTGASVSFSKSPSTPQGSPQPAQSPRIVLRCANPDPPSLFDTLPLPPTTDPAPQPAPHTPADLKTVKKERKAAAKAAKLRTASAVAAQPAPAPRRPMKQMSLPSFASFFPVRNSQRAIASISSPIPPGLPSPIDGESALPSPVAAPPAPPPPVARPPSIASALDDGYDSDASYSLSVTAELIDDYCMDTVALMADRQRSLARRNPRAGGRVENTLLRPVASAPQLRAPGSPNGLTEPLRPPRSDARPASGLIDRPPRLQVDMPTATQAPPQPPPRDLARPLGKPQPKPTLRVAIPENAVVVTSPTLPLTAPAAMTSHPSLEVLGTEHTMTSSPDVEVPHAIPIATVSFHASPRAEVPSPAPVPASAPASVPISAPTPVPVPAPAPVPASVPARDSVLAAALLSIAVPAPVPTLAPAVPAARSPTFVPTVVPESPSTSFYNDIYTLPRVYPTPSPTLSPSSSRNPSPPSTPPPKEKTDSMRIDSGLDVVTIELDSISPPSLCPPTRPRKSFARSPSRLSLRSHSSSDSASAGEPTPLRTVLTQTLALFASLSTSPATTNTTARHRAWIHAIARFRTLRGELMELGGEDVEDVEGLGVVLSELRADVLACKLSFAALVGKYSEGFVGLVAV